MTAYARIPGRSGAICRVATEPSKSAKNAAPNSSADPAPVERRSSKQRSRMTNGTALLPDIDGRSAIARRFKDITSAILADQGGADQCSESRLQLIRRFAAAAVLAEQIESRLANGEQIDIQEHATLSTSMGMCPDEGLLLLASSGPRKVGQQGGQVLSYGTSDDGEPQWAHHRCA